MRAVLLLVLRTGTVIVVATAAVQFWGLAVRGETPALSPSIAFPPTAAAVAAVAPKRGPKGPAKARDAPSSRPTLPTAAHTPAPTRTRPATTPKDDHANPSEKPTSKRTRPGPKPSRPTQPQLSDPPAAPEIAPPPSPPPPPPLPPVPDPEPAPQPHPRPRLSPPSPRDHRLRDEEHG